jgi:hypothetical protein
MSIPPRIGRPRLFVSLLLFFSRKPVASASVSYGTLHAASYSQQFHVQELAMLHTSPAHLIKHDPKSSHPLSFRIHKELTPIHYPLSSQGTYSRSQRTYSCSLSLLIYKGLTLIHYTPSSQRTYSCSLSFPIYKGLTLIRQTRPDHPHFSAFTADRLVLLCRFIQVHKRSLLRGQRVESASPTCPEAPVTGSRACSCPPTGSRA